MNNKQKIKVNDLIILNPLEKPKSIYRVHCNFMFGDADGFETISVDIPEQDKDIAITILQIALDCIYLNRYGCGGFDDPKELVKHYNVKDFATYFTNCDGSHLLDEWNNIEEDLNESLSEYIISIPTDSNHFYGSFQQAYVTYFDHNGIEYEVNNI